MRRFLLWMLLVLALLSFGTLAQKSGGGVGGRSGFSSPPPPPPPPTYRVNPSPTPSVPLPTPSRPYRDYDPYPTAPVVVVPGADSDYEGDASFDFIALLVLIAIAFIAFSMMRGLSRAAKGGGGTSAESQVVRLRLAVLYSASFQRSLRRLAQNANTNDPKGLADLVDDTAALLLREESGWKFGSYDTWQGSLTQAEGQFDQWVTEERGEYTETFRNFEGRTQTDQSYQPQLAPDGRYLLVSVVLAVRGTLPTVTTPLRSASAKQALAGLSTSTPLTTLASYLSWTPEADGEALTEEDLLVGWPKLELL